MHFTNWQIQKGLTGTHLQSVEQNLMKGLSEKDHLILPKCDCIMVNKKSNQHTVRVGD